MKKFLTVGLLFCTFASFAGAKYQEVFQTEILSLNTATAVYSFERFRATPTGMEVCFEEHWANGGRCDKWFKMEQSIPTGSTFVGWRIGHKQYGHRVIDVYFKN